MKSTKSLLIKSESLLANLEPYASQTRENFALGLSLFFISFDIFSPQIPELV